MGDRTRLGPAPPTPFDPALLRTTADLVRLGQQPHPGQRGAAAGLHRVRHGVWIPAQDWASLDGQQRHAALVHATDRYAADDRRWVYSHAAAAAIWGLPRIDGWPDRVDVLRPGSRAGPSGRVRRHTGPETEPVREQGLWVTPPARTVIDVARGNPLPTGLAAADHALRFDLCTGADLLAEAEAVPAGSRLRRRGLLVAQLADARSMSPGESLSRAQMFIWASRGPSSRCRSRTTPG